MKELSRMLAISTNAAEAIRGLVAAPEVPESAGLRITPHPARESSFEASLTATPGEDDQVVEEQGAQVFLEPSAAELLDDKRLDAQIEAGQVTFAIGEQAD
jgi:iron-sulfur cluster assembly protein